MRSVLTFLLLLIIICSPVHSWSQRINKQEVKVADTNLILPPAWAFGVLYGGYTNQQETIERVDAIRAHQYPIDAYWIDSWFWSHAEKGLGPEKYIDFVADTVGYPNRSNMWEYLRKNNIKGGFWTWDCILETGNEKAFSDFNSRGYFSDTYIETGAWHNNSRTTAMFETGNESKKGTRCGNIDFSNPQAVNYFKEQMKHFFDEGADFIKLDRTSKINVCKAMFEMSQEFGKETSGRGFMLSHSFETENEEYKRYPTKWTDDTRSDWNIGNPLVQFNTWVPPVALKENIAMFTDPAKASSRIPFLTNDLGGFDMGKTSKPEEELYIRWLQFSMFNPITEVFSQPENPTANLAWLYSARADSVFRFYAQLRMQLFPYIYSYAHRSRIEGKPMIGKIPGQLYEYMFGDEMLVAPVYEKGAVSRKVYLPAGNWINYWTGELLKGNAEHTIAAPIEQIPLFIRAGSIIPMRKYAPSIEKGNNDMLHLHFYPGADAVFKMVEDDGISNDYLKGIYASTLIEQKKQLSNTLIKISRPAGAFKGINNRKWMLSIHSNKAPKKVLLNKTPVQFEYIKSKGITLIKTKTNPVTRAMIFELFYN
jgi:alpha-glucosidase (family GH31 glycosyl hydrolase)